MKEPILQDKRNEHIKFVKYCLELVASVTGSPVESSNMEQSVGNLNKVCERVAILILTLVYNANVTLHAN